MKTFNAKAILEKPEKVMRYIGMWPEVNYPLSYTIRGFCVFTIITACGLLMLIKGIQDFKEGSYDTGSYALLLMLVTGHAAFKVWFLLTNKVMFFDILSGLVDPSLLYHDDDFDMDLQDRLQFSKKLFNALFILCTNAVISIITIEFVLEYDTNPRVLAIETDLSHLISHISVWIFFVVAILYSGFIIGSFEGLVLMFLSFGIAQLQILQKEIVRAVSCYPTRTNLTDEEMQYYDKMVNQKLNKCVKRHNAIERYIASVEAKFALGFLVQYLVTLGVTGLIGLNFILASIKSLDFIRCVFFFMADLSQVFVVYYHCNEIILQSENIRDACYLSNWRVCGPSVRKTLYIMMERTKRPFYLTLGKFSIVSLNTFILILKTSMSYFTVLNKLCGPDSTLN